jgi:hypothetical protein
MGAPFDYTVAPPSPSKCPGCAGRERQQGGRMAGLFANVNNSLLPQGKSISLSKGRHQNPEPSKGSTVYMQIGMPFREHMVRYNFS